MRHFSEKFPVTARRKTTLKMSNSNYLVKDYRSSRKKNGKKTWSRRNNPSKNIYYRNILIEIGANILTKSKQRGRRRTTGRFDVIEK